MSLSVLSLIAYLPLFWNTRGQNNSSNAPQGGSYENRKAVCDFQHWMPPLLDKDFIEPVHHLTLENINGTIPAGLSICLKFSSVFEGFSLFIYPRLLFF